MISQPTDIHEVDVAIVGGGPTGSTVASLLRKYNPDLRVIIIEKAKFPREHVGESQLPGISAILDEMGVWDKVEAANFPVKLGGSYTWGKDADAWDFDFYPAEEFVDEPRPAKYEGQRRFTAFQVERDRYDEILLRHAQELGTEVREETMVREVLTEGDTITGLRLDSGEVIRARHYVDGSGHVAVLRKALGVESDAPTHLRNVAFWDYYDNAKWAVEIGIGGTRVQVRSLPYGWIWFIPLGPSRASVGFICPSEYYKESGLSPKELYLKAVGEQKEISALLKDAKSDTGGNVLTTKNWSHLANRLTGPNWWICGEAAGFADPILAAGMTLAHGTAREVAYSILEVERGELDPDWIKTRYDEKGRRNIEQHIRFAEYWYAANGRFTDLQEHCQKIAKESGLRLNPSQAWRWLAQGGFTNQSIDSAGFGAFDIGSSKKLVELFSGKAVKFNVAQFNEFKMNFNGSQEVMEGNLRDGRIYQTQCWRRGETLLPNFGIWKRMIELVQKDGDLKSMIETIQADPRGASVFQYLQTLEAMVTDSWVVGKLNKKKQVMKIEPGQGRQIRTEEDARKAMEHAKGSIKFAAAAE
ncbi:MAG: tryptophan 7-halogenase [Phycisphaerales bacterium]|nr:tryptophan 7-halogenase [Phycisphaerales bacterium]